MLPFEHLRGTGELAGCQTWTLAPDTEMCSFAPTVVVKRCPIQRRIRRREKRGTAASRWNWADKNDKCDQEGREHWPSTHGLLMERKTVEPFGAAGLPIGRKREVELFDYLANVLWRGFREVDVDGTPNPLASRWTRRVAANPGMISGYLMTASSHLDARLPSRPENYQIIAEQVCHQNMAMKWLRTELETFDPAKLDDILLIILSLASSRLRHLPQPPVDLNPFCPPLRSLNWLDVYGAWDLSGVHWNALLGLIERNGGISKVKLYGLPWLIS